MPFELSSQKAENGSDGPEVATRPKHEVLVVDDEPAVLKLLGVALRRKGFGVCQASGGEEAVQLFQQRRDTIGVVLLDVRMPGMDGPQTLLALRKIDPHVRCCFMSGSTGKYAEADLLALGAAHVFAKPFTSLDALIQTLQQIAQQPPPRAN